MADTEATPAPNAGSPTPSTAGPAVSARILKKRETDRRCQRMIRERTKSRIAYLEGLVEEFRKQDSSGRVETLMNQLAEMKSERDTLARKVKTIESIISDGKPIKDVDEPMPQHSNSETQSFSNTGSYHVPITPLPDDNQAVEFPGYRLFNKEFEERSNSWARSPIAPADRSCECSKPVAINPKGPFNKWRYANDTLSAWFNWPKDFQTIREQQLFDDTGIRGVVEGWDAVERRGNVHPAWHLLRGIDQNIFGNCDKLDRLAIMQVMSLLLGAHLSPSSERHAKLPAFYLKRPSQDMLHSYATEYFAWPGLRERFVFTEHRYCSNSFWKVFCESMKFLWPWEFRDCYRKNIETGLYQISENFNTSVHDIRNWAMGREMFQVYPELYADIPAWNHVPASITPMTNYRQPRIQAPQPSHDVRTVSEADSSSSEELEIVSATVGTESYPNMLPRSEPMLDFSFGAGTQDSTYDYALVNFMQAVNNGQQLQPVTNSWFNTGLDVFQLDAA